MVAVADLEAVGVGLEAAVLGVAVVVIDQVVALAEGHLVELVLVVLPRHQVEHQLVEGRIDVDIVVMGATDVMVIMDIEDGGGILTIIHGIVDGGIILGDLGIIIDLGITHQHMLVGVSFFLYYSY